MEMEGLRLTSKRNAPVLLEALSVCNLLQNADIFATNTCPFPQTQPNSEPRNDLGHFPIRGK